MNCSDSYINFKSKTVQETTRRLWDGVDRLGSRCRNFLSCLGDESLLTFSEVLGLEVAQLRNITTLELGMIAIEKTILLEDMFSFYRDVSVEYLKSRMQSISRDEDNDEYDLF